MGTPLFMEPPITSAAEMTVAVLEEDSPRPRPPPPLPSSEDEAARLQKRYEALLMVRTKAVKGKGAWYWTHLVPVIQSSDSGAPKAVKLRCSLCESIFSASNPSRTASEHLKRGTCPNFSSTANANPTLSPSSMAKPISSLAPHRKRPHPSPTTYHVPPLTIMDPSHFGYPPTHQQLVLSGGKDDLEALAMLENSVKKLKSPRTSPGAPLTKLQVESAMTHLANWVFEAGGAVAFSALEHPKFREFLRQVGLPAFPQREITGSRLDARYREAWLESEAKIRDVLFFQVAADVWSVGPGSGDGGVVSLVLNLPNGMSIFRRAVFVSGKVPEEFAEKILWETITGVCGSNVDRCAGIVSSKFKSGALRELESRNPWMVNLPCQLQAFNGLLKDLLHELPLCQTVVPNCSKVSHFFNTSSTFRKYKLHELHHGGTLRELPMVTLSSHLDLSPGDDVRSIVVMLEDVMASAGLLHSFVLEEGGGEEGVPNEAVKIIRDVRFWNDLEAVECLLRIVREMSHDMEVERPFVGQCLQLWDELRSKVKDWCAKFGIDGEPVSEVINKRFRKNYHPAWSAAFVLDPLYLMRDASGKYLPQFKCLTPEQEKDVDRLITRLVSQEEKHIALMELLKWRSEGLDRDYALAVQINQHDPSTGKMKIANPQISRLVWESHLREFKSLGKVAVRLIFLHATSRGFKCNSSFLRWVNSQRRSREGMERAHKLVFVAANSKLERRDLSSEEEKDAKLFGDQEDEEVSNEVLIDAASV